MNERYLNVKSKGHDEEVLVLYNEASPYRGRVALRASVLLGVPVVRARVLFLRRRHRQQIVTRPVVLLAVDFVLGTDDGALLLRPRRRRLVLLRLFPAVLLVAPDLLLDRGLRDVAARLSRAVLRHLEDLTLLFAPLLPRYHLLVALDHVEIAIAHLQGRRLEDVEQLELLQVVAVHDELGVGLVGPGAFFRVGAALPVHAHPVRLDFFHYDFRDPLGLGFSLGLHLLGALDPLGFFQTVHGTPEALARVELGGVRKIVVLGIITQETSVGVIL